MLTRIFCIVLTFFVTVIFVGEFQMFAATSCSATADNGSKCNISCNEGIASCKGGAKTPLCVCEPEPGGQRQMSGFGPGELAYFGQLSDFLSGYGSTRMDALDDALTAVIAEVVAGNDEDAYNATEDEYWNRRQQLTSQETADLDEFVELNAPY